MGITVKWMLMSGVSLHVHKKTDVQIPDSFECYGKAWMKKYILKDSL